MLNNPDRKDTYIKMFDARSTVKPGITGLAQVMGRRASLKNLSKMIMSMFFQEISFLISKFL